MRSCPLSRRGYDLIFTVVSSGLDSKKLLDGRTSSTVVDLDLC